MRYSNMQSLCCCYHTIFKLTRGTMFKLRQCLIKPISSSSQKFICVNPKTVCTHELRNRCFNETPIKNSSIFCSHSLSNLSLRNFKKDFHSSASVFVSQLDNIFVSNNKDSFHPLTALYSRVGATKLLNTTTNEHRKSQWRSFKSDAAQKPKPKGTSRSDSSQKVGRPQPQTLRRLLSLAAPEKWTLSGGIALLGVSSAVTMSVPFVVGTLIDTIYTGGQNSSALLSLVESVSSNVSNVGDSLANATADTPTLDASLGSSLPGAVEAVSSGSIDASVADQAKLEKVCALLAGVFVMGGAANCGRVYLMTTAGQRISQGLRSRVFASLLSQETAYFDSRSTGELISRLAADTPLVATAVTTNVADGVRSVVMASAAVAMMVYTSPQLALFGLSVVPLVALLGTYHGRKLRSLATTVQERLGACTQHAEERLSNVRTVRVFAQEGREGRAQDALLRDALQAMYREASMRAAFFGLTGLTGNMIILSVLYKGSSLVSTGMLSVGSLSAFLMYAAYVGISVSGLSSAYTELSKGAGAADRLFELMDRQPLMPLHGGVVLSPGAVSGAVSFQDVHFSYPTRPDATIFSGLDLNVAPGSVVAVVGGSGSGKSSVVALLLRLYDPQQGTITLDGADITSLDPASLRAAIGVVSQDPVLFSGSIRENLLYGATDPSSVTDDRIEEAAHQANALDFVNNFPKGFDTVVGERGVLLSGGQRQRLAIARALITDPRVLCLDEATSALDSESEHLVQEAVERLMRGRTVITIAHRLSTIRTADRVAVLQSGCVAEEGTYSDLLAREDGIFRRLVSRQATGALL